MEPFAIWNLLKNALTATEQAAAPTSEAPQAKEESASVPKEEAPYRPNACEEYFLRHEQIKNHRKK